jgi:hypothetical protein
LFAIACEDGDEGDGGRAADEEVGDHVGQDEGGIESIGLHAATEEPDDVFDAHQADDARQEVDTMSTTVAEKMLCAWEGCRRLRTRAHHGGGEG